MSDEKWFSSKLRFALMVERDGADTLNDCIFLLKAEDFEAAFRKAINIGEAAQKEYRNKYGNLVVWKFMEIISLDVIRAENLDEAEVYSEPIHLSREKIIPFGIEFSPETSKPAQTI